MTASELLEIVLRGAAAGAFAVTAVGILRSCSPGVRISGALLCLGAIAHTLKQSPPIREALGPALWIALALSSMTAGFLWVFVIELFEDRRAVDVRRYIPAALLLACTLTVMVFGQRAANVLWLIHNALSALLMAHALLVILTGWRGDLVEPRRRLRGPVLGVSAAYVLVISAVEAAGVLGAPGSSLHVLDTAMLLAAPARFFRPIDAAMLLGMALAGAAVFLRAEPELLDAPRPARAGAADAPLSAQDRAALAALKVALDEDEVWRREALTIGELAQIVGAPEHRLRRLINAHLGYRNFAAFLNERRIAAARIALADPRRAETSVSTIAYEVGFASLGPFNRAFKDAVGSTPTAWRTGELETSPILQTSR
jgi:AraC-like DNA-binding protein